MKHSTLWRLLNAPRFQQRCNFGALAFFVMMVAVGSMPGARAEMGRFASGLVLHATAYACLGLLVFLGGRGSGWQRTVRATLMVAAMGAVDEGVQSLFPYRTAALTDWMLDVAAAALACVPLWMLWSGAAGKADRAKGYADFAQGSALTGTVQVERRSGSSGRSARTSRSGGTSRRNDRRRSRSERLEARGLIDWLRRHERVTLTVSGAFAVLSMAWIAIRLGSGD